MGHTFRKPLPSDEQLALVKRAQRGDLRARHLLTESSMGFVYGMAGKYARGRKDVLDDLVGAGAVGLLEAIDRFDTKRTNKFLTYASAYIRMRMQERVYADASPLAGGRTAREQDRATTQAYARARAYGLEDAEAVEVAARETGRSQAKVRERLARHHRTFGHVSFDEPIGHGESVTTVGELVVAPDEPVDDVLSDEEGRRGLRERLAVMRLSDRERVVMEYRLMAGEGLAEVAVRLGVSRQRVHQIEEKLLAKLRRYLAPDLEGKQPRMLRRAGDRSPLAHPDPPPPPSGPVLVQVRVARERPKPMPVSLCMCSHPESWHEAGPCGHGCGCLAFRGRGSGRPSSGVEVDDDFAPGSCPAVKSARMHRPCGRPAIYGDLCVFHGMRAERGEQVVLYVPLRESVERLWPTLTEDERTVAKSYVLEHNPVDYVAALIHDTRTQVHHLAASLTKRLRAAERLSSTDVEMGRLLPIRREREAFQRTAT